MTVIQDITSLPQFHDIIKKEKYTIVAFYNSRGGFFQAIGELYKKLAAENTATAACYSVDVGKAQEIAIDAKVPEGPLPTFALYKTGERVHMFTGLAPAALAAIFGQTMTSEESGEF